MRRTAIVTALTFLLVPALVRAQEPVKAFESLNTRLKAGDKIIVTDTQGREHQGKILEISPSALTLDRDGGQTLSASEVQLVQERPHDSLKNGALIGLAAGLALGGLAAADCTGGRCDLAPAEVFLIVGGIYGGVGAAIGMGIDALIPGKKRVVYRAPEAKSVTRVLIAPVITARTKGVAVSLSF